MEHLFIINPAAGKADKSTELIEKIKSVKTEDKVTVKVTGGPGEATDIVKKHLREAEDFVRVYACGGDGTANEVLRGVIGFKNCALGVIPMGSGNDFVRSFEENTKEDFINIEAMMFGEDTAIDVMECQGRYSMNNMSVGFDAAVAKNVDKFKRLPFVSGSLAYKISIVYCLFTKRKHRYRMIADGKEYVSSKVKTLLAVAGNGKYYGGGIKATPLAQLSDGKIEFMHIATIPLLKFILLIGTYIKGDHIDNPKFPFVKHTKCESITFESEDEIDIGFDGEILSLKNPTVRIIPAAVRIIIPKVKELVVA